MNAKTLKALKDSIAHWKRMATGNAKIGEIPTGNQCALCVRFYKQKGSCDGCPVMEKTGRFGCEGTPYWNASSKSISGGITSKRFKSFALKELNFLRSLLPEKTAVNLKRSGGKGQRRLSA